MSYMRMPQCWFENWFNSPYYHLLYRHRNEAEARNFITQLVKHRILLPDKRVLDLACGRGRHAINMNKYGMHVTGIDLSEENIRYAQKHANASLEFFVHDMRNPFRINYYDYVTNLFSSFGYFDTEKEHTDTIRYALHALKNEGKLIIDFMNADYVKANLVIKEEIKIDGIKFEVLRNIEKEHIIKEIKTDRGEIFYEKVKLLTLKDFEKFWIESPPEILHLFGDYKLAPYNENTSERLIIVAVKKQPAPYAL